MKRLFAFLTVLALTMFWGCDQSHNPTQPGTNDADQFSIAKINDAELAEDLAEIEREHAEIEARAAEILAGLNAKAKAPVNRLAGGNKITVPDDYATIQEAVNAAAPGTKVKVKSGVYNEYVTVTTADLRITGEGAPVLNGYIGIYYTSGVQLDGFTIDGYYDAILIYQSSDVTIKDNTITGQRDGIDMFYATGCLIKDNDVSTDDEGIEMYKSHGNTLDENISSGNKDEGLKMYRCDDNEIKGNEFNGSRTDEGIWMYWSHRNEIEDNVCNDNDDDGIALFYSTDNTIGSDNICNNNGDCGIALYWYANDNMVKKNEAFDNGYYDIYNYSAYTSGNVFKKNDCVTTYGF